MLRPTTPFLLYLLSRVEGLLEGTGVHFQIGTRRKKCTQSSQIFTGSKRTFFLLLLHAFFGFYHVATLELPPAFLNCGYMRDLHPKLHSLRCSSLDGVHIFFYHIFLLPFSLQGTLQFYLPISPALCSPCSLLGLFLLCNIPQ